MQNPAATGQGKAATLAYPRLVLPQGGKATGYGETFQPNSFTGTASLNIPIPMTPGRAEGQALSLRYSSGSGNDIFGLGFTLGLSSIFRRTEKGTPGYTDADTFIYNDSEQLVVKYQDRGAGWEPVRRTEVQNGITYLVTTYCPRIEAAFDRIEQWMDQETGVTFWQVTDRTNRRTVFGRSPDARIADPQNPTQIFKWLIEESADAHGNRICYEYKRENGLNIPLRVYNQDRSEANCYIDRIRYGNYQDEQGQERFAFSVLFDYGEYELPNLTPVRPWLAREDQFSTYRAGFEIRTSRLCHNILMVHHFPNELAAPECLVSVTHLTYNQSQAGALLQAVQRIGYRMQADGSYQTEAMPPFELSYSEWNGASQQFRPVQVGEDGVIPGLFGQGGYQLLDLYGDGLPGVLYTQGETLVYWRPKGDGTYAPAQVLPSFPSEDQLLGRTFSLLDVAGNGHLDLVVGQPARGGYYRNQNDGTWAPYQEFASYPPEFSDPDSVLVDLTGAGQSGLLAATTSNLRYYPPKGDKGFGAPITRPNPIGPVSSSGPTTKLLFADIFGDGLSHRVRITDGNVEVWPNLGNGRFGAKVTLGNAPRFGASLTAERILTADVTGSGTSDLLFLYADHAELYLNLSGNRFSDGMVFPIPGGFDQLDQAQFADLFGTGLAVLVISKGAPEVTHNALDFSGGLRPFQLSGYQNNMGLRTQITYQSSTEYYLRDQAAGHPWVTKLAFPVSVVAQVETTDLLSHNRTVRTFAYSDGYYDPVERDFRGFGYVRSQDTVTFDPAAWNAQSAGFDGVQPSVTKAWNRTGAFMDEERLARQYAREYFQGDPLALTLPTPAFEPTIMASDADTIREAYRALADHEVRTEAYGVGPDGLPLAAPFRVEQATYRVRLLQPRLNGQPAVFLVTEWEAATSVYESNANDPRIEHRLTLEADEFGNVARQVTVHYPRRKGEGVQRLPDQAVLKATVERSDYINRQEDHLYVIGRKYKARDFELNGLNTGASLYLSFAEANEQVARALAQIIPYGQPFAGDALEARLYTWWQEYFWSADQRSMLPLGEISDRMLLHHRQEAVLSDYLVQAVYGERVTPALLTNDGGYQLRDGYWWNDGLTTTYADSAGYFQPVSMTNPFAATTQIGYDPYWLQVVSVQDALGQRTTAVIDYQSMKPSSITDHNQNTSEALYDPLQEVLVTAVHGIKDGQLVGNAPLSDYRLQPKPTMPEILADPERYLQGAGTFFFYDLSLAATQGQPAHTLRLIAHKWAHPAPGSEPGEGIGCEVTYYDGAGRQLAKLSLVTRDGEELWLVADQVAYDGRGEVARQYLPYFASGPAYQPEPAAPFSQRWVDALGREVQTLTPKGFLTRTVWTSWSRVAYDEDDTVVDSPYYQAEINNPNLPAEERTALVQAAVFYGTPTTFNLDNQGHEVQTVQINVMTGSPEPEYLCSYTWVDIAGNALRYVDPRFYNQADPANPTYYNWIDTLDMASHPISRRGADQGNQPITGPESGLPHLTLLDVLAKPIVQWDPRGYEVRTRYDITRRPTEVHVVGNTLDQITERFDYGADPNQNNVGRLIRHDDQSGIRYTPAYDLLGNVLRQETRLLERYKTEVNWNDPESVPLLPERWLEAWQYDAAGQLLVQTHADQSETRQSAYPNGWVRTVSLIRTPGLPQEPVVKEITYHPAGSPLVVQVGNGVTIQNRYDPLDYRLIATQSKRESDGQFLQDLAYFYDPVGNVTYSCDSAQPTVFWRQGEVDPAAAFTYDALYQLRVATGRQQAPGAHRNDGQQLERYTERYTYDLSSNLKEINHVAAESWTRKLTISDFSDQAVPESMTEGGAKPSAFFDASGNQIALEHLRQITYDYRGKMASATVVQRETSVDGDWYQYDSGGQRTRKVVERTVAIGDPQVTDTRYIGQVVLTKVGDQQIASLRVTVGDRLVLVSTTQGTERLDRYQLDDRLGSVTLEVDQEAKILTYEEYFPFGGTALQGGRSITEIDSKRYRYSGKELDQSTGLYYYGLRYYIPWLGRWTTPDPAGAVDGPNLYRFVRNNPVTLHDAKGACGKTKNKEQPQQRKAQKDVMKSPDIGILSKIGVSSTVLQAIFEGATNLQWIKPPGIDPKTGNVSTGFLQRYAAHTAFIGSVSGAYYYGSKLWKYGWDKENGLMFTGYTFYGMESGALYLSFVKHAAHLWAGRFGVVADTSKLLGSFYQRKYGDVGYYSLLAAANYKMIGEALAHASHGSEHSSGHGHSVPSIWTTVRGRTVPNPAQLWAQSKSYQFLVAAVMYKTFQTLFFSDKDKH